MGWHRTALMGAQEVDVPDGIPMCIRILVHWNTEKTLDEDLTCLYAWRDGAATRFVP